MTRYLVGDQVFIADSAEEAMDKAEAEEGAAQTRDSGDFNPAGFSVPEVLDYVGDDINRAIRVLELEEADKNRKGIVDPLSAMVDE